MRVVGNSDRTNTDAVTYERLEQSGVCCVLGRIAREESETLAAFPTRWSLDIDASRMKDDKNKVCRLVLS